MSTIKSVVLSSAGLGSRLGLGQTKALIKIREKPLIQWQLELLRDVEDVRIVIGFQANEVVNEVLKIRKDIVFIYNHDYVNTKTGSSLYLGARDANEFVIAWDGDLIVHPDDILKILNTNGEFICYSDITSEEAIYLQTNELGEVTSFSKILGDYEWTGPACIRKSKLMNTPGNVFEQIEPYLPIKGIKIRAYDIDTFEDYVRVSELTKEWV